MPGTRIFARLLASLSSLVLLAAQDDTTSGCTVGTLEDSCVSARQDNEVGHTPPATAERQRDANLVCASEGTAFGAAYYVAW